MKSRFIGISKAVNEEEGTIRLFVPRKPGFSDIYDFMSERAKEVINYQIGLASCEILNDNGIIILNYNPTWTNAIEVLSQFES